MKSYIRSILDSKQREKDALVQIKQVGARLGETLGIQQGTPPSTQLKLSRGSKYGEDGRLVSSVNPIPVSGYLEFINKSDQMCAMKVLLPGGTEVFEIPRPSYMAVPPGKLYTPNHDSYLKGVL